MIKPPEHSEHAMLHRQLAPGSDCPGRVAVTGQRMRRRECYDEWTCRRCGANNYGASTNRRITERIRERMASEITGMKLKLCVHRKAGAPGYGSDGAGAEIEIDMPDELVNDPAKVVAYAQIWYGSLERSVDDQLARMASKHPQAGTVLPVAAAAAPAPDRRSAQAPPEGLEEYGYDRANGGGDPRNGNGQANGYGGPPSRRNGPPPPPNGSGGGGGNRNGGPPRDDAPRNGKQLIGWANGHGKYDELMSLAKAWNMGRIVDWSPDDAVAAFHELSRPAAVGWGGGRS